MGSKLVNFFKIANQASQNQTEQEEDGQIEIEAKRRGGVGGLPPSDVMETLMNQEEERSEKGLDKVLSISEDFTETSEESEGGLRLIRETQNIKNGVYILEWALRLMKQKRKKIALFEMFLNTSKEMNGKLIQMRNWLKKEIRKIRFKVKDSQSEKRRNSVSWGRIQTSGEVELNNSGKSISSNF